MAYMNATTTTTILSRLQHFLADTATRYRSYRLYRETLNELSGLSDRELADLGLHRSQIRDVARSAVAH